MRFRPGTARAACGAGSRRGASSIHSLVIGCELTKEPSFLDVIKKRLEVMKTDALPRPIDDSWTQHDLAVALEKVSHLPPDPNRPNGRGIWSITNGLRVFGWTHGYTLPWALDVLEHVPPLAAAGTAQRSGEPAAASKPAAARKK